ncbi:MAG: adenosylmethionine--8-amino-7-oxononanoate transaminase [Limisphaerales bacterium]
MKGKADAANLDRQYVWHPFTQMRDWVKRAPRVMVSGRGAVLTDAKGKEYLDANSSIWTNLHGHRHPKLDAALGDQAARVAHVSSLGLANEPAALLAEKLVLQSRGGRRRRLKGDLGRVFFSDDGSTAMEAGLKMVHVHVQRERGVKRPRFLSIDGGYHGDTVGAVSLGHIDLFHGAYKGLLFGTDKVMSPYCYRCPYNRAKPERADAREYRRCSWECVGQVERKLAAKSRSGEGYAGFVFEPLLQGAAGMIPQPEGWLRRVAKLMRQAGTLFIADEVMTGFGRVGGAKHWLGSQVEGVKPDVVCLAKGLTGGYLPMAATLVTEPIYASFLGRYEEFRTFFHGHSYSGNPLGAAVALASLEVLNSRACVTARARLEEQMRLLSEPLWESRYVGDVRQVGLVLAVELVQDWRTRRAFALGDRVGMRVCEAMAERGVLTRPIGNVVVVMPPYCTTSAQLEKMVAELRRAIRRVLGE